MLKLSIIIPSFQRSDLLKIGLTSLLNQQMPKNYEIIVLNDGIPDETEVVCNSFNDPNIKYIFTGQRNLIDGIKWRLPCYAINVGFRLSRGEFIILTGAEIYHLDNIIPYMIAELESDHRQIIITKGKDDREGKFLNLVKNNFTELNKGYDELPHRLMTEFPFFMGLDREEVISIGGYDEELGDGYCFDDADFVDRIANQGYTYKIVPGRIVHLYHPRLEYGKIDIKELWEKNKKIYEAKKGTIYRNIGKEWGKHEQG